MNQPNFKPGTVWIGDNLPVMRGMNSESVDLIYLDPPFNSNRNYDAPIGSQAAGAAFKDAWTLDDVDVHEHGELADRNEAAHAVIEAARLTHSKGMTAYLIMMAVRLLEMRRVLKPTGSIYLHCDDAASSYLRLLMDAIFGKAMYRNTITWQRTSAHNDPGRFGRVSDHILFYSRGQFTPQYTAHDLKYVKSNYRHKHASFGPSMSDNLTGANSTEGESGEAWGGWNPTEIGRHWAVPKTGSLAKWIDKHSIPGYTQIESLHERLDALDKAGFITWTENGTPRVLRPLASTPGRPAQDIWGDVPPVSSTAKERTNYPTQKPLALLERIIKASSNKGDTVFDPFCGCATALVAADRLGRDWIGCDLSPIAVKLVDMRIAQDRKGDGWGGANALNEPPRRTDLGPLPDYRTHRHRLYGEQEGICAGCAVHFPFKNLTVDHILPRSRGGTDHGDNLQLLCGHCNSSKGSKTMSEWKASKGIPVTAG